MFSICLFSHLSLSLRTVPAPMSLLGETGGWGTTYLLERRLLDALILTVPNFATSNPVVDKATVDALVVCNNTIGTSCVFMGSIGVYISAWASALLVLTG